MKARAVGLFLAAAAAAAGVAAGILFSRGGPAPGTRVSFVASGVVIGLLSVVPALAAMCVLLRPGPRRRWFAAACLGAVTTLEGSYGVWAFGHGREDSLLASYAWSAVGEDGFADFYTWADRIGAASWVLFLSGLGLALLSTAMFLRVSRRRPLMEL